MRFIGGCVEPSHTGRARAAGRGASRTKPRRSGPRSADRSRPPAGYAPAGRRSRDAEAGKGRPGNPACPTGHGRLRPVREPDIITPIELVGHPPSSRSASSLLARPLRAQPVAEDPGTSALTGTGAMRPFVLEAASDRPLPPVSTGGALAD